MVVYKELKRDFDSRFNSKLFSELDPKLDNGLYLKLHQEFQGDIRLEIDTQLRQEIEKSGNILYV